jgi:ketosteroid isomerase-like protein
MAFALYHPDHETMAPPGHVAVGFDPVYRGRDERVRLQQRWRAEWGEFRYEPEEIIDLGDRALVIGRVKGSGLSSGAAVDSDWAMLYTSSGGQVIRDQIFLDRGEALEAAGLEA